MIRERIQSNAWDLQHEYERKFKELMDAQYEALCAERGVVVVDSLMVASAWHRLIEAPKSRIAQLESEIQRLQGAAQ